MAGCSESPSFVHNLAAKQVVRVGVNLDGIHVIDDKINECLLSLPYDQFHYNSYEVGPTLSPEVEPTFDAIKTSNCPVLRSFIVCLCLLLFFVMQASPLLHQIVRF